MTHYVLAYVPASLRQAAETAVAQYITGAGDVWSVPLTPVSGLMSGTITHYGLCTTVRDTSALFQNLAGLSEELAGSAYSTVPIEQYSQPTHWAAWLESKGLKGYTGIA